MITIVDSGIANVGSVLAAFRRIGATVHVTRSARDVLASSALVLPGVGAFKDGMDSLHAHGLVDCIRRLAAAGTPILGICLGMHLLADASEEFGEHAGLGLVPGRVVRLTPRSESERVPNIGWCDVHPAEATRLFDGVGPGACYFVHSYYMRCEDPSDEAASIEFGGAPVTAAIERGTVCGTQFHPEKSQDVGLAVLHNFARLVGELPS